MANIKEYQIKINGISESISAIDSLNNKLQNLEQRINAINTSKETQDLTAVQCSPKKPL